MADLGLGILPAENHDMSTREAILQSLESARWHVEQCRNDPLGVDQMALGGALRDVRDLEEQLRKLNLGS